MSKCRKDHIIILLPVSQKKKEKEKQNGEPNGMQLSQNVVIKEEFIF